MTWPAFWTPLLGEHAVPVESEVGLADGAAAHFGDPTAETRRLLGGERCVVPLVAQGALVVEGADRVDFVNGQVSHDVRSLPEGGARLALLLDHKGRPQAGVTVVSRPDDLYLSVDDGAAERVRASLEAHVVFDQVMVRVASTLAALVVTGDDAATAVSEVLGAEVGDVLGEPDRTRTAPFGDAAVLVHGRRRGRRPSADVHVRAEELPALWAALRDGGAVAAGERALAAARVEAGLGAAAAEGAEALPQEAGLDERVSYRKGCYLGQEIMARIEARGTLHRGLARLELDGPPRDASSRAVVDDDGRSVGSVGTVAELPDGGWTALAVVRTAVPAGAVLHALGVRARLGASMRP